MAVFTELWIAVDVTMKKMFSDGDEATRLSTVELAVIAPTFNEVDNVSEVVKRVRNCLIGVNWELIFVDDDSPDGTADRVRVIAQSDPQVRCIQRIGRRGLASACIEGMLSTSAPFLAVVDADLQHDETLLQGMLDVLKNEHFDIVVGSRYTAGGGIGQWDKSRAWISGFATKLSRLVLKAELADPMSGFFMIRRDVLMRSIRGGLSGIGFKILLDIFASSPQSLRFKELPYEFRERQMGDSKLDTMVGWEFLMLLLDKLVGRVLPIRFIMFSLVGGFGVLVHMLVLFVVYQGLNLSFLTAQTASTIVAMTSNFLMNNILTYRDRRLHGWRLLRGWLTFVAVCSVGAFANVGIAAYLYDQKLFWVTSAIAGILVGTVWNYAVTAIYTWRKP